LAICSGFGPVRIWAALRASSVASRFEALHLSGPTDLVGREEDFPPFCKRFFVHFITAITIYFNRYAYQLKRQTLACLTSENHDHFRGRGNWCTFAILTADVMAEGAASMPTSARS
jgi:hypothetical protein